MTGELAHRIDHKEKAMVKAASQHILYWPASHIKLDSGLHLLCGEVGDFLVCARAWKGVWVMEDKGELRAWSGCCDDAVEGT